MFERIERYERIEWDIVRGVVYEKVVGWDGLGLWRKGGDEWGRKRGIE